MVDLRIFTAMNSIKIKGMSGKSRDSKGQGGEKKRDHLVFLICIILAAGFWFLIKLSDIYPVSYQMKIKYTHVPTGRLITTLNDSSATLHFRSTGYNLLDLMLHGKLDSLSIDLKDCDIRTEAGNEYYITTSGLRENVAQLLGINDRDLEFTKSKLRFTMERLHRKNIKISALLDLSYKSQFSLYDFTIIPEYITVYGPQQILDTLKVLSTDRIHIEKLDGDKKIPVSVHNPYPGMLRLLPPKVIVQLNVEKYTEQRLQVPIDVSGIHPEIRTFPTTASVNFNVFLRDYEKIHVSQFQLVPNDKNIDLRQVKTLRLELTSFPKEISNIRIVPPEVEFIIVN